MKVAVFGAGALGAVYGVRLALHGDVDVAFVVRTARVSEHAPIVIERVRGNARDTLDMPRYGDVVPEDADAILLAVGTEDLASIGPMLAASEAPIVVLTPMLPRQWSRMRQAFGERVHAAIPAVVSYARKEDGVVRYWLAPTPTKIDEPRSGTASAVAVNALRDALSQAGLRCRLELGVHEKNPATTVCFIPIGMVVSIAGSARALEEDEALLSLATRACREGVRLSYRLGEPELWARLAPMLAAPWALPHWLGALRRVSPEALFYFEEHFGRKLTAQNRVMIDDMTLLAREKGLPHEALDELARRFISHA
jgi:ketopantoate reductase